MKLSALSSGSSGNCFYIENNHKSILIDAGISAKQTVERMQKLNLNPESVLGIFVTHEHADHIKGIDVLARSFQIPIFATNKIIRNNFLCSQSNLINEIRGNSITDIAGMKIEAFSKFHKSLEPVSYSIKKGKTASVITDAGFACENIIERVSESDFLFLESNHDTRMLEQGPYPYFLKKWISSNLGHMSNLQSALCVLEHGNKKLKNLILSHLSKTNNTPELALATFKSLVKERADLHPEISVSLNSLPTKLFEI